MSQIMHFCGNFLTSKLSSWKENNFSHVLSRGTKVPDRLYMGTTLDTISSSESSDCSRIKLLLGIVYLIVSLHPQRIIGNNLLREIHQMSFFKNFSLSLSCRIYNLTLQKLFWKLFKFYKDFSIFFYSML